MAKILEMPKLSPTMEEGQLSAWHKDEGDEVGIDDLLAEVETDKATMEFRSFDKGTLLKILAPPGSMVKLGQPVAILGEKGEDVSGLLPGGEARAEAKPAAGGAGPEAEVEAKREAEPEAKPDATREATPEAKPDAKPDATSQARPDAKPDATSEARPEAAAAAPADTAEPRAAGAKPGPKGSGVGSEGERVRASPYVRKLSRERGIDLHGVSGSGPAGRIIARDVEGLAAGAAPPSTDKASAKAAPGAGPEAARARPEAAQAARAEPERVPLSMMRKTIARRLTESKQSVPHFYLTIDVDAGPLSSLREQINAELVAAAGPKGAPEKVSLNDLLIRAAAAALVRVPECNAQFAGDALLLHRRVDISVAVAVADGLVTPVVRDADRKGVRAIALEVKELAERARQKKLKPEEMSDGTFSVSNLGMFGIDQFAAVINPPEGAILAIGRVRDEPVVQRGEVVAGKRLSMTLSCDHRVIDGATGARFLAALRALVEHPMQILLG